MIGASINMYIGVKRAGYTPAQELPGVPCRASGNRYSGAVYLVEASLRMHGNPSLTLVMGFGLGVPLVEILNLRWWRPFRTSSAFETDYEGLSVILAVPDSL
jgi:hypothetical protein